MPTATRTTRTATKRRKFLTLYPTDVRDAVRQITKEAGFSLTPSPTGSYARASINGRTLAYIIPGQRQVRVNLHPLAGTAPAKIRKTANLHELRNGMFAASARPDDGAGLAAIAAILQHLAANADRDNPTSQ